MADFLTEVDELMRQERMTNLWKKHGGTFISLIVLIIIATAAVSAYRTWDKSVKIENTNQLLTWIEDERFPQNIIETPALSVRPDLRAVALMSAANALIDEGHAGEALTLYRRAAEDSALGTEMRQLATLMKLRLTAQDEGRVQGALDELGKIWNDQKSPWRYHARLESASLLAHVKGDYKGAIAYVNNVLDAPNLPKSLYNKAQALSHIYKLTAPADTDNAEKQLEIKTDQES